MIVRDALNTPSDIPALGNPVQRDSGADLSRLFLLSRQHLYAQLTIVSQRRVATESSLNATYVRQITPPHRQ